ncbi:MAG: type IV pilus assembly protein PilM [Candidatus Aureabacteria bacterium]|nr:type IV pilus assembly protein PilM [Candidatus Auribacterota bacterium]
MLKSKTVLGINIGTLTIKLVEMERRKSGPVIVNYAVAPIPDAFELNERNAVAERNTRIRDLLKSILKEKKIKGEMAAVSVSNQSVFTRFVKMPFSESKKLEKLIAFEAQQQIPFPLEEVSWDYQVVGNKEGESEVLIAAIKQDSLNEQLQVFQNTPIIPHIVDIGAMALYSALLQGQIQPNERVIILDIGASPATLLIHHPEGYWVRTLPYSSLSLTQSLMRNFELSYEEAESLKFKGFIMNESSFSRPSDDINYKINHLITTGAKKLHAEITRTLNFYKTQFNDIEFDRIILGGGGSRLDDLKAYLSSKFRVTVDSACPLQGIEVSSDLDTKEISEVAYLFSEAVGLALRQIGDCKVKLNLMTVAANVESSIKKYLKYFYILCLIVGLGLGMASFFTYNKLQDLSARKDEIIDEDARLQSLKTKIKYEADNNVKLEREARLIKSISKNRNNWLRFYLNLNLVIPPEIYLSGFSTYSSEGKKIEKSSSKQVLISGMAPNRSVLDKFQEKLASLEYVQSVEMPKANFLPDSSNYIDFQFLLTLNNDQDPE